ncbi:uncharacterized skeletal organic matrix protein 5-like [Dendronephthya gigantea]|uniref:uncharacterized skeletal organic matrix protein 5-like n=1 Tax=Dendronephthya gigantea TaxID=151771 RepID=UPI00106A9C53|nr:uncharacterized skeletal organic matrix protein 5-like [Dendronephthya gigantea]
MPEKDFYRHKDFDYYELKNPNRTKTCTEPGQIYSSVLKQCYLVSSCKDLLLNKPSLPDGAYTLQLNSSSTPYKAYCHMTDITGCGAGGWTLVLKVDGNKPNFFYKSSLWTNKESYAVEDGLEGLTEKESKLASYWNTPFKKICLGMTVNGDRRWMVIEYKAHSLYNLIADGQYRNTSAEKSIWKSLIADSSLQENCNLQGFNILNEISPWHGPHFDIKARIGLIANNQDDCKSPDSWIGFGVSHHGFHQKVNLACGEYNRWLENILTFGYILVQ